MFPLEQLRAEMQREGRQWWRRARAESRSTQWQELDEDEAFFLRQVLPQSDEPTADDLKNWQPGGDSITSPFHIAVIEQLRAEVLRQTKVAQCIATDVFVFAQGEAPEREMTKIGGLPYRMAGETWPTFRGRAMNFIAQFCFADSRDIVADLPGDVLLVFGDDECIEWTDDDASAMAFEWVNLGQTDLVGAQEIPRAGWSLAPYYGEIHRTFDYPNATERFEPLPQPWNLSVLDAMKIGGAPAWQQPPAQLPGNFLCAVNSIGPETDKPYPFLNVPEPIAARFSADSSYRQHNWKGDLMWGDAGDLYLFLEANGKIHWTVQFG